MPAPAPAALTTEQLRQHPEFPHVFWDLKPEAKEKLLVARGRGGPFRIAYEIHGRGPNKMVWIMGLGSVKVQWQRQTKDFGHTRGDEYSCLVLDNRGMGESDRPKMRYSTSEMAKDAIEVINHIGWTKERQLHVTGISMGGMIAQELAMLIPDRIATLNLISTAAYIRNTVGFIENLRSRINLLIPKTLENQLAMVKQNCYTPAWPGLPDETEHVVAAFPTNGDRFAAAELTKRGNPLFFTRTGFLLQIIAAGWHRKSDAQLALLADRVGRERILVVHGTADRMITFPHGEKLLKALGGTEGGVSKRFVEGQGHVIINEMRREFNGWIVEMVKKAEGLKGLDAKSEV